jgi:vacuolar-type H+-ATPase subunit I/STV1
MVNTTRDEIANVLTLKELWERVSALETNVRSMLKCDDITKAKLDKLQQDAIMLDSYKESSAIRHKTLENKIQLMENNIEKLEELKADISSIRESTLLAKENVDMRLNAMNEFRGSLKDQAISFITRGELQPRFDRTDEDIRLLRESRAELIGKASQNQVYIAYFIAAVGIIMSIISLLMG